MAVRNVRRDAAAGNQEVLSYINDLIEGFADKVANELRNPEADIVWDEGTIGRLLSTRVKKELGVAPTQAVLTGAVNDIMKLATDKVSADPGTDAVTQVISPKVAAPKAAPRVVAAGKSAKPATAAGKLEGLLAKALAGTTPEALDAPIPLETSVPPVEEGEVTGGEVVEGPPKKVGRLTQKDRAAIRRGQKLSYNAASGTQESFSEVAAARARHRAAMGVEEEMAPIVLRSGYQQAAKEANRRVTTEAAANYLRDTWAREWGQSFVNRAKPLDPMLPSPQKALPFFSEAGVAGTTEAVGETLGAGAGGIGAATEGLETAAKGGLLGRGLKWAEGNKLAALGLAADIVFLPGMIKDLTGITARRERKAAMHQLELQRASNPIDIQLMKLKLQDSVEKRARLIETKDPGLAQMMQGLPETTASELIIGAKPNRGQMMNFILDDIMQDGGPSASTGSM